MKKFEFLIIILCLATLLRLPSLFEPHWYGDEEVYLTIAQSLNRGAQLYKDVHDNKPPLLYWVAAAGGGSLFNFKALTGISSLVGIGLFWVLARHFFDKNQANLATALFAVLNTIPLIEGNIANAEMFFVPLVLLGFVLLVKNKNPFWAGLAIGLGGLFKIPSLFDMAVWPLWWLFFLKPGWFKKSFLLGVGTLLPLLVSVIYYYFAGTLHNYLIAAGLQNIPYLSSWQAVSGFWGTLTGRAATAAMLVVLTGVVSRRLGEKRVFLLLWFVITLFACLLSGRPYPHYLLQLLPAFVLLLTNFLVGKKTDKVIGGVVFAILIGALALFKFYAYPVFGYYENFLQVATGKINKTTYYAHFNPQVNTNYQVAQEIVNNTTSKDKIFVWGDEPSIYALTRRSLVGKYTVAYHVFDFRAQQQTLDALKADPPKYILVAISPNLLPGLWQLLEKSYILTGTVGNVSVYRHLNITAWNN